jgi:hypothetical protein
MKVRTRRIIFTLVVSFGMHAPIAQAEDVPPSAAQDFDPSQIDRPNEEPGCRCRNAGSRRLPDSRCRNGCSIDQHASQSTRSRNQTVRDTGATACPPLT